MEHPILFSDEMVLAILDGRKTQTRRVIKPQPFQTPDGAWHIELNPRSGYNSEKTLRNNLPARCPYGDIGDHLWVREAWAHDDMNCKDIRCGNRDHIWWRANEEKIVADSFAGDARWRPSIYMPRWASRITLEIVAVRVEHLQEIGNPDAKAEGVIFEFREYRNSFIELWDSINHKRGYGWNVNPWVWVIEFKQAGA